MKKIYFTIILLITLSPFTNCFSQAEIIKKFQVWIDQEVSFQLGTMKGSGSVLKELFADTPEYSVKFTVAKKGEGEGEGEGNSGSVSGAVKEFSFNGKIFPGPEKFKYTKLSSSQEDQNIFLGKILLDKIFFDFSEEISKLGETQPLTAIITHIGKQIKYFSPKTNFQGWFDSKAISANIEYFVKNGTFNEAMKTWDGNFINPENSNVRRSIEINEECYERFSKALPKLSLSPKNGAEFNNATTKTKKLEILNNELKTTTDTEKNRLNLHIMALKWICNIDKVNFAENLKALRGTVIHELCHPLTMQYYFLKQDEQRPYYEGVNVLISGAYELSQRYCSKIEYFARINGEYKEFCEARMADLNMSELAVPTFTQLKYLSNKAKNETVSPEKTLETALGIISQYSNTTAEQYSNTTAEEDKRALREILKQYVAVDTAEERNTAVDSLLNHKIGTNEFHLISLVKNGKYVYKKNGTRYYYAIKSSDKLTGIAYCEIIKSDVNKNDSVYRLKDVNKNDSVYRLKFENWKLDNCDAESFEGENLYTVEKDDTRKLILAQEKRAVLDAQKQINSK